MFFVTLDIETIFDFLAFNIKPDFPSSALIKQISSEILSRSPEKVISSQYLVNEVLP